RIHDREAILLAHLVLPDELLHPRLEGRGLHPTPDPRRIPAALPVPERHHGEEHYAPDEGDGEPYLLRAVHGLPPDPARGLEGGVHGLAGGAHGSSARGRVRTSQRPQPVKRIAMTAIPRIRSKNGLS